MIPIVEGRARNVKRGKVLDLQATMLCSKLRERSLCSGQPSHSAATNQMHYRGEKRTRNSSPNRGEVKKMAGVIRKSPSLKPVMVKKGLLFMWFLSLYDDPRKCGGPS